MSSIEERFARDIAAVTQGVVVTESDLRDARNAVDERIDSKRQRDRRRTGEPPADRHGATSPLLLDGEIVGFWVRTREGVRPLAVHAGWQVDAVTAVQVVLSIRFGMG